MSLIAATEGAAVASSSRQVVYEFARAAMLEGWWIWALLIGSLALLLYACIRFYRRDAEELATPVRWTLVMLRLTTVVALIFFFLVPLPICIAFTGAYFEASAYRKFCGTPVTTWDAVWLDLRIDECGRENQQ